MEATLEEQIECILHEHWDKLCGGLPWGKGAKGLWFLCGSSGERAHGRQKRVISGRRVNLSSTETSTKKQRVTGTRERS